MEWVLIVTMSLGSPLIANGDLKPSEHSGGFNLSHSIVSGFFTKRSCELAGKQIFDRLVPQAAKHTMQETDKPMHFIVYALPSVKTECLSIRK